MQAKPRVIVVSPYPPTPPFAGGRRRTKELIARLTEVACVTVASVVFDREDELSIIGLFGRSCDILLARPTPGDHPSSLPAAFAWAWSSKLAEQIESRHRMTPFDVAIASHSYAFPFIAPLKETWKVVDAHNLEYRVHAQFAELSIADRERLRLLAGSGGDGYRASDPDTIRAFEQFVWATADAVLCVSEVERLEVASTSGGPRTLLVPNASVPPVSGPGSAGPRAPVISFAGALNYIPNIDAVLALTEDVVPIVREVVPGAQLLVAGREPNSALVRYCTRHSVIVVADPEDIFATLAGSVMAVPLRMGSGTRIKILEARSHGLPVVASTIAVEGLGIHNDPGVVVADAPDAMAGALMKRLLAAESSVAAPTPPPTWDEVFQPVLGEVGVHS